MANHGILFEGDSGNMHYQVTDTLYDGREARVLYSGNRQAAQAGIPKDGKPDMLFDYNQRFFELATALSPKRILIIGGGVQTLAISLLAALPDCSIDTVEPDQLLYKLAQEYFGLAIQEPRLRQYDTDGRSFLAEHNTLYDMIFVDAFVHTSIPRSLKTREAAKAYQKHLNTQGVLAMNIISGYYGPGAHIMRQVYAALLPEFDAVDIFYASRGYSLWLPQNFVVTAQKGSNLPLQDYLRHGTVKPPEVNPNEILED